MPTISVIIVNYNVEQFLQQCLYSVQKAIAGISAEVFVVDNDSTDRSCRMVKTLFPFVHLIENAENVGFSKANNQAIRQAQGKYILLLNPDTIIEDSTLSRIVQFMDAHADAGGLGVKMIDGRGRFLPESKRGVPTPLVAFYKISGLSTLFPRSSRFNQYHLGHLDKDELHSVPVLSGAFMLLRTSVLDSIGYLDEDYFMYGEDIDLSCRILKAGYRNYYFPHTTIIHFKGESTRKGSLNYVVLFYRAMYIFYQKQFASRYTFLFCFFIQTAIFACAFLSVCKRLFHIIWLPVMDFVSVFVSISCFAHYYAQHWKGALSYYPDWFYTVAVPFYSILWVIIFAAGRCYRERFAPIRFLKTVLYGTVLFLVIYALLPENFRFSRAILLWSSLFTGLMLFFVRFIVSHISLSGVRLRWSSRRRYILVGDEGSNEIIKKKLVAVEKANPSFISEYSPAGIESEDFLRKFSNFIANVQPDEVIFSAQSISSSDIIKLYLLLPSSGARYHIADYDVSRIYSCGVMYGAGNDFDLRVSSIYDSRNVLKKRTFDIIFSLICILVLPLSMLVWKRSMSRLYLFMAILKGKKTWVSVHSSFTDSMGLPRLSPGAVTLSCDDLSLWTTHEIVKYLNNYSPWQDVRIILHNCNNKLSD